MKKSLLFSVAIAAGGLLLPVMAHTPTAGEEIDLGLSVNWRGYDIGASAPQETGTQYPYALIEPGNYNYKRQYPFFSYSSYDVSLPVPDISGDPAYDAAAATTDGAWRIATKEEWEELLDGCTFEYTKLEGVGGFLVTSKTNGNSIFLPAGTKMSAKYYTSVNNGKYAYYFNGSDYESPAILIPDPTYTIGPWNGYPIRPVCDKSSAPLEAISLTIDRSDIFVNNHAQITATAVPEGAKLKAQYTSSDENVATVTDKGLVKGVGAGTAVITVSSGEISSTITVNVTAVETDLSAVSVDLGLSVDWCTMNEGAASIGEIGDKYAFSIATPNTYQNAMSYPYYNGSYRFPKAEFGGDPSYDAIAKNHGADSRMRLPSKAEFEELVQNTDAEIVQIEDVRYVRFTSTVNGRYILLPMEGKSVLYNSSSTNEGRNVAYMLYLTESTGELSVSVSDSQPYKSRPLRGVVEREETTDLTAIKLDMSEATIYTENTVKITAAPEPLNADLSALTWSSSDEAVATVNEKGVVTGIAAGTAVISAAVGEIKATATVTVIDPDICTDEMVDMGLEVLWAPCELGAESPSQSGDLYYWGAMEPSGNVSDKNKWTDPGIDVIGATEYDVISKVKGEGWRMPTRSELYRLTQNSTFEWIVNGGREGVLVTSKTTGKRMFWPLVNGSKVIFYYGDQIFRDHSSDGEPKVDGIEVGKQAIDIYSRKPWTPLPLRPVYDPTLVPLKSITISSETTELVIGGTLQLTAVPEPEKAEFVNLTWTSSDESIATVDATGLVTGLAKGKAVITATDGDVSASIELTVIGTTSVSDIVLEREIESIYTMDGRKVTSETENLRPGFYIVVKTDGTVVKTVKR